ncbi:MAG: hypothetical protein KDD62_08220, partial [Bdellovibrionales bacterium]|nr:hypothetical protein [Bdellovibrionales bacterium]
MNKNDVNFITDWLQSVLQVIVRVCIKSSIDLNSFIEVLKVVYVRVAEQELEASGKQASASRISVMTGVHRRDIARFKKLGIKPVAGANLISKIMGQWQHDPQFTTKKGGPRVLGVEGRNSEFAQLVAAVNGADVSTYSVLHEMEHLGVVVRVGKKVKLIWRDYAPQITSAEGLQMYAEDMVDLFKSIDENVERRSEIPNLHLRTDFDKIPLRHMKKIREWLLEEGSRFHKKVRSYLSKYDNDVNPSARKETD